MTTTTPVRRAAVALTVLWPLAAASGLWFAQRQPDDWRWDNYVLAAAATCAGILVLLVLVAGPIPAADRRPKLGGLAGALTVLGLGVGVGVVGWRGDGCSPELEALVATACAVVGLGALLWPWVVLRAPGRRSRWLLGPAAGVYVLATTLALMTLRDVLWDGLGGCGQ